jgi:[ribosomal protein S5]-alanine N-acetyltransferase
MILKTKRMIIRELTIKDAKELAQNLNNIKISKWLFTIPNPYSLQTSKKRIKKYIENNKKSEEYRFVIELTGKPGIIGCLILAGVDTYSKTAQIGYWLNQNFWGHGLMEEALSKFISYTFKKIGLRKINAEVFTENKSSIKLLKKFGFKLEGTIRKNVKCRANGRIHDVYAFGLLRNEWKGR